MADRLAVRLQDLRRLALRVGIAGELFRVGDVSMVTPAGIRALEQALGRKVPIDTNLQDEIA